MVFYGCKEDGNSVDPPPSFDPIIPAVKIISPTESDELIDSVYVDISASDDKGILKVEEVIM